MPTIEAAGFRELVEAAVTAVSVLGGSMAYFSGYFAALALAEVGEPEALSQKVNEGLGLGFLVGSPMAVLTLIIEACTRS